MHNIRIRLAQLFLLTHPDVFLSLPSWLSQFSFSKLRQPTGQTEQRQDATKKNNRANFILISWGKSGIIKFLIQNYLGFIVSDLIYISMFLMQILSNIQFRTPDCFIIFCFEEKKSKTWQSAFFQLEIWTPCRLGWAVNMKWEEFRHFLISAADRRAASQGGGLGSGSVAKECPLGHR